MGHCGKKKAGRRLIRRRATLFEAVAAICLLFFIFLAMLQVYQWCVGRIFCQYAAFHASKSVSLGYRINLALRCARVAAIPISGAVRGRSSGDERRDARNYMVYGDGSGVRYDYWYPQRSGDPELDLNGRIDGAVNSTTIRIRNAPLLHPNLGKILGVAQNPEPRGQVKMYNYSAIYLEE